MAELLEKPITYKPVEKIVICPLCGEKAHTLYSHDSFKCDHCGRSGYSILID